MSHSVGNDAPTSAAKLLLPKHYIPGQSNSLTSSDAQSIRTNWKCLLNAFSKILEDFRFVSYCLSTEKGPTLLKYILLLEGPKTMKGRSYFMAPRVGPLIYMFTDTILAENL
jgi:hypothetical protein